MRKLFKGVKYTGKYGTLCRAIFPATLLFMQELWFFLPPLSFEMHFLPFRGYVLHFSQEAKVLKLLKFHHPFLSIQKKENILLLRAISFFTIV